MKYRDAIRFYGQPTKLATALGYTRQAVDNWRKRGFIPELAQRKIEDATGGKLKAERL